MVSTFREFVPGAPVTEEDRLHQASRGQGLQRSIDGDETKRRINPARLLVNFHRTLRASQLCQRLEHCLPLDCDPAHHGFQSTRDVFRLHLLHLK